MRRRYLKGEFEDRNKYFRCPKCGFVMNREKHLPSDRMSKTITDIYEESNPYDTHDTTIYLDELSWLGGVERSDDDVYPTTRNVKINIGCPFCGNVNF